MSGHIKGYVNGVIEGEFTGLIDGEMGAVVRARDTVEQMRQNVPVQEAPPRLEAADEAEGGDIRIVSCGNGKEQEAADDSSGMPEDGRAHASWNRTESDKETESARVQKGEEEEAANHDER